MRRPFLPLLVAAMPLIEIAGFIVVGRAIGVLPTLGLILLSAVLGFLLLRRLGGGQLRRIEAEMRAGRMPGRELVHTFTIAVASFLLIAPGFVTDILGLLLFLPPVRELVWRWTRDRIEGAVRSRRAAAAAARGAGVVDLPSEDFERRPDAPVPSLPGDETRAAPRPGSPWAANGASHPAAGREAGDAKPTERGNRTLH